ncbi:MAG: pyrimidine-nucleoside phosphorylase [Clostridiales bacterium]|nr:pyrimidine-nucleoside phosphorylase [Clostridiales bacterium]
MRMYELIEKKKRGESLSHEEIHDMVMGFVEGEIPDYQMAAMLMAICFRGMTEEETFELTMEMEHSGDTMDLSAISGCKVDKHSTGGVGDKTTLIVAPLVAACGGKVAKMSGRGLGHTGGTIDKLESIPGFQTALTREEFFHAVETCGLSVIGQSGNLVPADKKIYALRDVTATVDCIPLIASSIMSKKLAAGSDAILLDVKTGSGAFMKSPKEAAILAELMVHIGTRAGRKMEAVISNMNIPLGNAVGNALEVKEAIEVLKGRGPKDLTEVCLALASRMLILCGCADEKESMQVVKNALKSGAALEKLKEMIRIQGGDPLVVEDPERLPSAAFRYTVRSKEKGYLTEMNAEGIGMASMILGAGRQCKTDVLDYGAGILLYKKCGDYVVPGDPLAEFFYSDESRKNPAEKRLLDSLSFDDMKPKGEPLIYSIIKNPLS